MSQQNLRFGVLGVGRIGKIHAENLVNRIAGAEVAALSDVSADELARVAARLNVTATYTDCRQVLELPEVDAVAICTPSDTHKRMILDAAAAGKHIFCEKPVELSVAAIEEINQEVAKRGIQLMVGFNRRFDPNFLKVRETVQ